MRCGHCKEVFDASLHLQVQEAAPLLPEMPLDALKSPPQPVGRASEGVQVWTSARPPAAAPIQGGSPPEAGDIGVAAQQQAHAPAVSLPRFDSTPFSPASPPPVPSFLLASAPPSSELQASSVSRWAVEPSLTPTAHPISETTEETSRPAVHEPLPGYELPTASTQDDSEEPDAGLRASEEESGAALSSAPLQEPPDQSDGLGSGESRALATQDDLDADTPSVARPSSDSEAAHHDVHAASTPEPSFVKAARRDAFWRRPIVRGGLVLSSLVLLLTLVLQIFVHERDDIASRSPVARVWLEKLCASLQCTLQPLRRISAVVIDSSSFLRSRGDPSGYQLQMSVKNSSPQTVAMPALELTLTDAQDQAIVRRVLLREELNAPLELPPGFVWSGAMPLQVAQGAAQVAGYRLVAFYP